MNRGVLAIAGVVLFLLGALVARQFGPGRYQKIPSCWIQRRAASGVIRPSARTRATPRPGTSKNDSIQKMNGHPRRSSSSGRKGT
jgi:hypothetical protein